MKNKMCLDNSWNVMCEEEMYDVNGGWLPFIAGLAVYFVADSVVTYATGEGVNVHGANATSAYLTWLQNGYSYYL